MGFEIHVLHARSGSREAGSCRRIGEEVVVVGETKGVANGRRSRLREEVAVATYLPGHVDLASGGGVAVVGTWRGGPTAAEKAVAAQ